MTMYCLTSCTTLDNQPSKINHFLLPLQLDDISAVLNITLFNKQSIHNNTHACSLESLGGSILSDSTFNFSKGNWGAPSKGFVRIALDKIAGAAGMLMFN